jgi:hypothetical protein
MTRKVDTLMSLVDEQTNQLLHVLNRLDNHLK